MSGVETSGGEPNIIIDPNAILQIFQEDQEGIDLATKMGKDNSFFTTQRIGVTDGVSSILDN